MPRFRDTKDELGSLEAVLAGAGDGVFVIRGDGRIALWNRVAERILGHAARETVGRACCEIFAGFDGDGNRLCYEGCHVQSLVRMGESVQSFDMRTRTKAGRPVWLNVSVLSMNDAAGEKVAVHLFRDVTATKELLSLVHERLASPLPTNGEPAPVLSRREIEVLRLMVEGLNTAAAATRLHVSRSTVRNHVQNIFAKLGVHSRLEAVAYAARHRLL